MGVGTGFGGAVGAGLEVSIGLGTVGISGVCAVARGDGGATGAADEAAVTGR